MTRMALGLMVMGALPGLASGECREIKNLPARITNGGVYCVKQDLAVAPRTDVAILVEADGVVLDLGGHTITGRSGVGVNATGRRSVSVSNGVIRGFRRGVVLEGAGGLHRVDRMKIEALETAITVEGRGNIVRRNRAIGGGIVARGPLVRLIGNDVSFGAGEAAIRVVEGAGSVVEGNRVSGRLGQKSTGVLVESGENVLVLKNVFREVTVSVELEPGRGVSQANELVAAELPAMEDHDAGLR